MNKLSYLITGILLIFSANLYSQDIDSTIINLESDGILVNLQSAEFTNNVFDLPISVNDEVNRINIGLNATAWKFSKILNLGGFSEINAVYSLTRYDPSGYAKFRILSGSVYGEGDYYLNNSIYTTVSAGTYFITRTVDHSPNVGVFSGSGKNSINYLWAGIGFGRIVNTSTRTKEENFEKILKDNKIISGSLPIDVKVKLDKLIEKRNNKDFLSSFKDDADAVFFGEVETVLLKSGVIKERLDAETAIKLYNTLTNERYLYYPNYSGFQHQLELQLQVDNNSFLTFGSIWGESLFSNTNILTTGFISLPLDRRADLRGLFNIFKNPFTNYLPIIVERYKIDNSNYIQNREYFVDISENQDLFAGIKTILFYKFNEFAGIRGFVSTILNKPSGLKFNNLSNIGTILDYNIFSRLTLSFQTEYTFSNLYRPDFYYNLGFLWNVF